MFENYNILLAFGLTIFAGLSTGIGSLLAFFAKRTNTKFLSVALGFSGGVMIYVSFVVIFREANISLTSALGHTAGSWMTVISFFGGILMIALIDKFVPKLENPHEARCIEEIQRPPEKVVADTKKLMNTGIYAAIAIAVHNFPEGIATFTSTLKNPLIHNIPEGIAVSVPIYFATGSKKKAFWYSFLSGAAEPMGAVLAFLVLMPILNDVIFGVLFAAVAGIMVFIALDELLPASREYGEPHLSLYGLLSGMAVMAVSLLLFI